MSYYNDWLKLTEIETKDSFQKFWDDYCETEVKLYTELLKLKKPLFEGTFGELAEKYDVDKPLFMGFLDGIQTSLVEETEDIKSVKDDTMLKLDVDLEKLYLNMLVAEAQHLYSIEEWDSVFTEEKRAEIEKAYKKSRTVRKEATPSRNDPCPCGSGKKYKKCCGAN